MKAWKITAIDRKDNVFTEVYTKWNDVLFIKNTYEVLEMQEITI